MNKVDTINTYPLAIRRPQLPSRGRLYVSCILLSALSALPFVALLAYKDLIPAPYMTAWNWLMASFAAYPIVTGIFQLQIKATRIDRLLCAVLSYFIWIAVAGIGGAMALMDASVIQVVLYFFGLKLVPNGILLPIYLFGPALAIAITRCCIGPQPARKTAILGCGQHTAPLARQAAVDEDCVIKIDAPHTVRPAD